MDARQVPTDSYAWDPEVSKVLNSICIQLNLIKHQLNCSYQTSNITNIRFSMR